MIERQFWWVRVRYENGDPGVLQLAEVAFEGSEPREARFMGTSVCLTPADIGDLTLIEQVLPAGRAVDSALGYFEAAYWKAQESSQAEDWMHAALLGKQLACALRGQP